jgi:hypothetical protein
MATKKQKKYMLIGTSVIAVFLIIYGVYKLLSSKDNTTPTDNTPVDNTPENNIDCPFKLTVVTNVKPSYTGEFVLITAPGEEPVYQGPLWKMFRNHKNQRWEIGVPVNTNDGICCQNGTPQGQSNGEHAFDLDPSKASWTPVNTTVRRVHGDC